MTLKSIRILSFLMPVSKREISLAKDIIKTLGILSL